MKQIRQLILLLVAIPLFLNIGADSNATTDFVPAEEIVEEIRQTYDKYGIDNKLINFDASVQISRSELDAQINQLDEALAGYSYYYDAGKAEVSDSMLLLSYTKTYTTYANLRNGRLGNATIELTCSGTIYDGSITFTSISNIATRQYGSAFNFVSWTQNNSGYTYMDNKKKANVWAEGTLVTEANIAGQVFRQTQDHGIGMIIQAR